MLSMPTRELPSWTLRTRTSRPGFSFCGLAKRTVVLLGLPRCPLMCILSRTVLKGHRHLSGLGHLLGLNSRRVVDHR